MIVYLDSSVILRVLLGQEDRLAEWRKITHAVSSALIEVECLRTLDRLRLRASLDPAEIAVRRASLFELLEAIDLVDLGKPVLSRAAQPFPTLLGTLDAIHLATALMWKETQQKDLALATHDTQLALAARASGLHVLGTNAA